MGAAVGIALGRSGVGRLVGGVSISRGWLGEVGCVRWEKSGVDPCEAEAGSGEQKR
jgi:hypothetical protein